MGQIVNPLGADGTTALNQLLPSWEREFKCSGVVTAGYVVAVGTDGQISSATTGTTASLCIGIAKQSASTNGTALVVLAGIAENVNAQGTIAAGDILMRSGTTSGYVAATATPGVGQTLGVAINASASNVVDVWVLTGA